MYCTSRDARPLRCSVLRLAVVGITLKCLLLRIYKLTHLFFCSSYVWFRPKETSRK